MSPVLAGGSAGRGPPGPGRSPPQAVSTFPSPATPAWVSPLRSLGLCVTFPLSLLVRQIIRASITALEAITISSRKDLLRLKRRPPWISLSCPPRGRQALPWGPWITPCPDITPPVRLSASLTSCRTPQETRPVPNPTCPGPCTPCPRKFLAPVLHFLRYPSTVVLTMAITCHIHQK